MTGKMVYGLARAMERITRIIQSLYYAPAGRYINAWMHSLKKSLRLMDITT